MRLSSLASSLASVVLVSSFAACGSDGTDDPTPDAGLIDPPARGFQVKSTDIVIEPGQEITYCYYFRTPNTEPMAVRKWVSAMTPGSHHMIMFTTANDKMPPGTVSATNCGQGGSGTNFPNWTYAAQEPNASVELPGDDGTGKPLAQLIQPNTAAFFQMHYLNATENPMTVSVTLNAEALEANAAYTGTQPYITYDSAISIPPNTNNFANPAKTCNTPAGAKFWSLSSHSHKQSIKTEVRSGAAIAFEATDWEHPGSESWMAAPFYTFDTNRLTFQCTYNNSTNRTITAGDSAATDEMCMATGYYFPATAPALCVCAAQGCINL